MTIEAFPQHLSMDNHIDIGVLQRTVRLHVAGPRRNSVTRFEIAKCFKDILQPTEMEAVFRCETPNVWYVTVSRRQFVDTIVDNGMIEEVYFALHPERCDQRSLTIRVQWLPTWFDDDNIAEQFVLYGKVIRISRETATVGSFVVETGTRVITMLVREGDQDKIPYRARVLGKAALIIVPGRPPICLRCQEVGHIRSQCPGRRTPTTRASYAAMAAQPAPPVSTTQVTAPPPGTEKNPVTETPEQEIQSTETPPDLPGEGIESESTREKRGREEDDEFQPVGPRGKHRHTKVKSPPVYPDSADSGVIQPGQGPMDTQQYDGFDIDTDLNTDEEEAR